MFASISDPSALDFWADATTCYLRILRDARFVRHTGHLSFWADDHYIAVQFIDGNVFGLRGGEWFVFSPEEVVIGMIRQFKFMGLAQMETFRIFPLWEIGQQDYA